MRTFSLLVILATVLGTPGQRATPISAENKRSEVRFADNQCMAKGGIGIITPDLYIVTRSDKNELLLSGGKKWIGHDTGTPEVVTVFNGEVSTGRSISTGFDLSKATIISFEADKVRFFDFEKMSGGYYRKAKR